MDVALLVKALTAFFAIMNPFVNLPLFLSLTRADLTPEGHALVLTDTSEVPGTGGLRPRALGTWPNPLACSGMDLLRTLRSTGECCASTWPPRPPASASCSRTRS